MICPMARIVICMAKKPAPRSAAAIGNAGTKMCMASVPVKVSIASSQSGALGRGRSVIVLPASAMALLTSFMRLLVRSRDRATDMPEHPDRRLDVGVRQAGQYILADAASARLDTVDDRTPRRGQHDRLRPAIPVFLAFDKPFSLQDVDQPHDGGTVE